MGRVSQPERAVRQAKVFELFVAGQSYRAIASAIGCDKDTVTADVRALTSRLDTWADSQKKRALSYIIATYQRIIDEAWAAYDAECQREKDWLEGKYDRSYDAPDCDGGTHTEFKPPPWKSLKVAWLNTIRETAVAYTKVVGIEAAQKLELTGKDGTACRWRVEVVEVPRGGQKAEG